MQAVVRSVDWDIITCLVLAGPGFTKDAFKTYLEAEAVRQDVRYCLVVLTGADDHG